ncbi:hypothetical protein LSCM1_01785 [Leishmania martiniquensis]|uniref:Uncharacterized protein n=1 Tax=Leishmania martiniquensis TaxID=1580590 RepID=A0A836KE54_9TRYP|nr:hypothetical protein LSCM1_01785 [Leishmania martiniquensis]
MIVGVPGKKWVAESASDLFVSPQADLSAVLSSETVVDYLHSIQPVRTARVARCGADDSDKGGDGSSEEISSDVQAVLRFIERHADTLFALLHEKACIRDSLVSTNQQSHGTLPTGWTTPAEADVSSTLTEKPSSSKENHAGNSKMPCGAMQASDDSACAENAPPSALTTGGDTDAVQERRCLANVTELLSFCITHSPQQCEINAIVAACIEALSLRQTLEAQRTFAVQRLLLEAFDNDFETTTQTIADTLTHSTINGVVRNLASNSIIAETLIALFGSALSAVWMVKPTTRTALFTSQWIRLNFPTALCVYLPVAIRDPSMYHYFYFFKELLKRGYSHSAGPIVDVLLSEPLVSNYVEDILRCGEEAGRAPILTPVGAAAAPVSLAADGMEVLVSIISLVRKSLVLPETSSMYNMATQYITPVAVLQAQAPRMVALLAPTATEEAELDALVSSTKSSRSPLCGASQCLLCAIAPLGGYGLGPLRLAVCELFVEFSLFQLAGIDSILITSGFFPAFIRCCERFPQHDALARALHRCILAIFQRPMLAGEGLSAAAERDRLWKYLVQAGTVALLCGRLESVLGALTHLAQIPDTSLSSFCIDALSHLSSLPLFQSAAGGPFEKHLEAFKRCEAIQGRVRYMAAPVTGERFKERGSAGVAEPVHRDTINLAGDRFHGPKAGGISRGSRLSGLSSRPPKGAYIIVRHSADNVLPQRSPEEAVVDMESLKQEVHTLRQAGSPAVQSYPSFSSVRFGFSSSPSADSEDEPKHAAVTPLSGAHSE